MVMLEVANVIANASYPSVTYYGSAPGLADSYFKNLQGSLSVTSGGRLSVLASTRAKLGSIRHTAAKSLQHLFIHSCYLYTP